LTAGWRIVNLSFSLQSDVKSFAGLDAVLDAVHAGYTSQKPLDRAPTVHFTMNLVHGAVLGRHTSVLVLTHDQPPGIMPVVGTYAPAATA